MLAQLPAPNSAGVAMGHLHLNTTDPEVESFGGTSWRAQPIKFANAEAYKFVDAFVMVRKAAVSGGTEGTAVNHPASK